MDKSIVTLRGGVAVPLLQAVVSGALVAALAGVVAVYLKASQPWLVVASAWSLVTLGSWTIYRGEWRARADALLGVQAEPVATAPQVNELRVHVVSESGTRGDFLHLADVSREQLETLARGLAGGKSLSVHLWTGKRAPFSRPQYERLRAELTAHGFVRLASENSVNSGYELTSRGRALVRALAESHSPTTSPGVKSS